MVQEPASFELNVEDLLRHDAWLRSLVRSIVSDDVTSDVLQQTWLAALLHPPREAGALRRQSPRRSHCSDSRRSAP